MVVEARVKFRHEGCYSERLPEGVQVMHLSGDQEQCLCTIRGPEDIDLDPVVDMMAAWIDHPPRILDRGQQSLIVRCECPTRGLTPTLLDLGASVLWPVVHRDGYEWWHLLAPDRDVMARVITHLETLGNVEVEQLGDPSADEIGVSLPLGELTSALSARQLSALTTAINRGYYETPKETTLENLAEEFGVARSTFQEHLQKAEERIMDRFGGVLADHPSIIAAATRSPGRPSEEE